MLTAPLTTPHMSHAPRDEESPLRYVLLKEDPKPDVVNSNVRCVAVQQTKEKREQCYTMRDTLVVIITFGLFIFYIVLPIYEQHTQINELMPTFNVTQLAEFVTLPERDTVHAHVEILKHRFVSDLVNYGSDRDYVCARLSYYMSTQAISEFEEMLLPHFQLSTLLSSVSELCFVKN